MVVLEKLGPFFYVNDTIISNCLPIKNCQCRLDKMDNPYGHDQLWDDNFQSGEYIDYPRGRVVWDLSNNRAIVYIDKCINKPDVINKIVKVFDLSKYVIDFDDHYHCKDCVWELFDEV